MTDKELLGGLVATDPRASAEAVLRVVQSRLDADAYALLSLHPDLDLFISNGITQRGLDRVHAAWDLRSRELLAGELLLEPTHAIAPIGSPASALLYLEGDELTRDRTSAVLAATTPLLDLAIAARAEGDTYVDRTSLEEIERRKLQTLLDRVRGNISAFAEVLGVTRVTAYSRLRRCGIEIAADRRRAPRRRP